MSTNASFMKTRSIKADICMIVPTLNEEAGLRDVLSTLPKKIGDRQVSIIVIDGHSKDKTAGIAEKMGVPVILQSRKGKGSAMRDAIRIIDANMYAFIDGDGTYDSKEMANLIRPLIENKADMAVGIRHDKERGAMPLLNQVGNKIFNSLLNRLYGVRIVDMLSGYRAIQGNKLRELVLITDGFEIETELTIEAAKNRWRIVELPLKYRIRKGSTKLRPISSGFAIMKTILFMFRDARPFSFFGGLSVASFLLGLIPGLYVVHEKLTYGTISHLPSAVLATLLVLISVNLFSIGLFADMNNANFQRTKELIQRE